MLALSENLCQPLKPLRDTGLVKPETDDELWQLVYDLTGVAIPRTRVCEHQGHSAPFTAFADAYFARGSSVHVWKASRGFGGKSFMLALLAFTEFVTLGADVGVLGGSGKQSTNVVKYSNRFWNHPNAPVHLLKNGTPGTTKTQLTAGNEMEAQMASQRSVRGPHPQRLRLDEIDEMSEAIFNSAMGQTMSNWGIAKNTVASSTHQYADKTMSMVLKRAAEEGWNVYEWCYRENLEPHGWLTEAEVVSKRSEVTKVMWEAEYELQEPSPQDRAIDTESVKRAFKRSLGVYQGEMGKYIEIERPKREGKYVHAADWARKQDFTIIVTFRIDVRPWRLVAFERLRRLPWPFMVGRFDWRFQRFGRRSVGAHDGTGIGDVVAGYIKHDAESVILTGRFRSDMLSNYINAIEKDELEFPFIKSMESEHRLATVDAIYTGGVEHLPDTIAAGAIAYHRADQVIDWSQVEGLGHVEGYVSRWK